MKKAPLLTLLALLPAVMMIVPGCSSKPKVNIQAMTQQLQDPNPQNRENACIALAKAGPDAAPAVQALIPLLKDKEPLVRRLAAYALGEIGPAASAAIPALISLSSDPDQNIDAQVANSLRQIAPKKYGGLQNVNVQH